MQIYFAFAPFPRVLFCQRAPPSNEPVLCDFFQKASDLADMINRVIREGLEGLVLKDVKASGWISSFCRGHIKSVHTCVHPGTAVSVQYEAVGLLPFHCRTSPTLHSALFTVASFCKSPSAVGDTFVERLHLQGLSFDRASTWILFPHTCLPHTEPNVLEVPDKELDLFSFIVSKVFVWVKVRIVS